MEEGWVPKKLGILHTSEFALLSDVRIWLIVFLSVFRLDVYIDVPDVINISHMRSNGLQPGEELLPEGDCDINKSVLLLLS